MNFDQAIGRFPVGEMNLEQAIRRFPVGVPVDYYPYKGSGDHIVTEVDSVPWKASSDTIVIRVKDVSGYVSAEHLVPRIGYRPGYWVCSPNKDVFEDDGHPSMMEAVFEYLWDYGPKIDESFYVGMIEVPEFGGINLHRVIQDMKEFQDIHVGDVVADWPEFHYLDFNELRESISDEILSFMVKLRLWPPPFKAIESVTKYTVDKELVFDYYEYLRTNYKAIINECRTPDQKERWRTELYDLEKKGPEKWMKEKFQCNS